MPHWRARDTTTLTDAQYQDYILDGVSRTFALTIPQLPPALHHAVGNAYLLCRIADTIEDDPDLSPADKTRLSDEFIDVVASHKPAETFARTLSASLSPRASEAERDLIAHVPRVIRLAHALTPGAQRAMLRCIKIMATGMAYFQRNKTTTGLADVAAVDRYCYHVAGVVGEMLTELYVEHSAAIANKREAMLPLAVSFGEGLQMTNILKDIWDDLDRGSCWLPRELFARHGIDLALLGRQPYDSRFGDALADMIAIAHGHLQNALRYTLMIPASERGLRKFCLWAIGMAVLTLRKINGHRDFRSGETVKISRTSVRAVIATTNFAAGNDRLLRRLFAFATRSLPRPSNPVTISTDALTERTDAMAYPLTPERTAAAR